MLQLNQVAVGRGQSPSLNLDGLYAFIKQLTHPQRCVGGRFVLNTVAPPFLPESH
jgi:hypothetical protein